MTESDANAVAVNTVGAYGWLSLGAAAGPALFTFAWLVLGQLSRGYAFPTLYIARHSGILLPISALGVGPMGLFMNTAFVLCGLLLLVGLAATFRRIRQTSVVAGWSCTVLLALSPLGLVVCGFFTMDSMFLYSVRFSLGAMSWLLPFVSPVHSVGFLLAVVSPVFTFAVVGLLLRRFPVWRRFGSWLILGSPFTLVLVILFFRTFNLSAVAMGAPGFDLLGLGGLTNRALMLEVHSWFVALGWLAFRGSRRVIDPHKQN
jgi:hypothetical protein